jgi:demethylmenaquinone methyltransferase/2-methoxy-6-polyprenyl-1,4-benzoquinol methylase
VPDEDRAGRTAPRAPIAALTRYYADEAGRRRFLDSLFDDTARDYDFIERLLGFGSGPWYRRSALGRAGLAKGMRVLDIATGTGLVAREALAIVGASGAVVGLDPSAGMLREARRMPLTLVRGFGERLPFADASFDFVSMGFALRHVADLDALVAEIRRVLVPGGAACILEITRPASAAATMALRIFMTRIVPALARIAGRRDRADRLMGFYWDTIDACVPPQAVLSALDRAGLSGPRRGVSLGIFSEYVATR